MISHNRDADEGPTPEVLDAFFDGELDGPAARQVAAWLGEHPEAACDADARLHATRAYRGYPPPEPGPDQWAGVLRRIERALEYGPRPGGRRSAAWVWAAVAAFTAAAAVLLAVTLGRLGNRDEPAPPLAEELSSTNDVLENTNPLDTGLPQPAEEPMPVLAPDEVRVISVDDPERPALVVGQPPVREPLALLARDEVTVSEIERDDDGPRPLFSSEGDSTPMIVSPLRPLTGKAP